MSEQFEVVERVDSRSNPLGVALVETAKTGKAIKFSLNGSSYSQVYQRLNYYMDRNGLRLRIRKQGDGTFVAWAEVKAAGSQ
jgi:hypothetical protein